MISKVTLNIFSLKFSLFIVILQPFPYVCMFFSMKIKGLDYLGANLTIDIQEQQVVIEVHRVGDFPLVLRRNDSYGWGPGTEESLTPGTVQCGVPLGWGLHWVRSGRGLRSVTSR